MAPSIVIALERFGPPVTSLRSVTLGASRLRSTFPRSSHDKIASPGGEVSGGVDQAQHTALLIRACRAIVGDTNRNIVAATKDDSRRGASRVYRVAKRVSGA
jgi:hypothetical protein